MSAIEAAESIVSVLRAYTEISKAAVDEIRDHIVRAIESHVARALLAAQPSADDRETAHHICVRTIGCHPMQSGAGHRLICDYIAAALASRAAAERARVIAIFAPFLDRLPADAKAEAMALMDRLTKEERK